MKFANLSSKSLRFDIAGAWYECAPGELVEIPDKVAFAVESRGLPLTPASEVEPAAKSEPVKPEAAAEKPAKRGK